MNYLEERIIYLEKKIACIDEVLKEPRNSPVIKCQQIATVVRDKDWKPK